MMHVLFVHSPQRFLSRLITSITGESVSHCALRYGKWVIHSNQRGLNIETYSTFTNVSTVLYAVEIPHSEEHLFSLLSKHTHAPSDILGLLYFGVYFLLKHLGLRRAAWNLWGTRGKFTCVEWVSYFVLGKECGLLTPMEFYRKLKAMGYPDVPMAQPNSKEGYNIA